ATPWDYRTEVHNGGTDFPPLKKSQACRTPIIGSAVPPRLHLNGTFPRKVSTVTWGGGRGRIPRKSANLLHPEHVAPRMEGACAWAMVLVRQYDSGSMPGECHTELAARTRERLDRRSVIPGGPLLSCRSDNTARCHKACAAISCDLPLGPMSPTASRAARTRLAGRQGPQPGSVRSPVAPG